MIQDPDSLYHVEQALEHVTEAIDHLGVPLFALEAKADEMLAAQGKTSQWGEAEIRHRIARDAQRDLTIAQRYLKDLRHRLSQPSP